MRAAVTQDTTSRIIKMDVAGAPDIDVTRSYHRKPRIFRPEQVTIHLIDGVFQRIKVAGGLMLKSGAASTEVGESQTYYPVGSWASPQLDNAPEWVQVIVAEAPQGVTTWRIGPDDQP